MPRRDGTGPMGEGAKTGRGLGPCTGETTRFTRFTRGRGMGQGMGRGFGRGRGFGFRQNAGRNGSN